MSKVIISASTEANFQNAALIQAYSNRKKDARTRLRIYKALKKAIEQLQKKNGKQFNKNIVDHFKPFIVESCHAPEYAVFIRYEPKSNWSTGEYYEIYITVGDVSEYFKISEVGRVIDIEFMLSECEKWIDIRSKQFEEIANIDTDAMIDKINKIRAAYELLGSELGDFVNDFKAMQHAFELDNNAAPKNKNFVFLKSYINR